jgi:pantothenate synthetase
MPNFKYIDGKQIKLSAQEEQEAKQIKEKFKKIAKSMKEQDELMQSKKASGKQKLKDLGLDDDEIKALTGV